MFYKNEVSVYDLVSAISEIVDLASPVLNSHHKKVAYMACNIAMEMNLPNDDIQEIVLASMLHDIGAFTLMERINADTFELEKPGIKRHAMMGYRLLKGFAPFAKAAELIRHHHAEYVHSRQNVPLGSYIIHFAGKLVVLFDEEREILQQIPVLIKKITENKYRFHPDVIDAFLRLTKLEYVWVEALIPSFSALMMKKIRFTRKIMELETMQKFAQVIAHIIDFRSRFTAAHSHGVAAVSRELVKLSGFSDRECKMMEIAGLLHDLGKLAVPNDILEKNGKLSHEEFNVVKKHTYYTYSVLSKINGLEEIAKWSAFHHEKLDGDGYPFHVKGENFPLLARYMSVADILTALMEDRPYRTGMNRENASKILFSMAEKGEIDRRIVELTDRNFVHINDKRISAQQKAWKEYDSVYHPRFQSVMNDEMSA